MNRRRGSPDYKHVTPLIHHVEAPQSFYTILLFRQERNHDEFSGSQESLFLCNDDWPGDCIFGGAFLINDF